MQRKSLSPAFQAMKKPRQEVLSGKQYQEPYFKHAMTSFVLCLQDSLNQRRSQAFSLLKQSIIIRSH